MAHKKAGGSSRNGRDSEAKRLGVKRFGGQVIPAGNIIIDMSKVTFISSAGIGVTVKAHSVLKQKGFEVRVAAANDEVKKVYDLLGFSHVVKLFPTLNDALKS